MVDVHKRVIILMDPISAPAGMVLRWIMIITHVLVCSYWFAVTYGISYCKYIIQILKSVLLILTTVLNCVWRWMEDMSVIALMDMN